MLRSRHLFGRLRLQVAKVPAPQHWKKGFPHGFQLPDNPCIVSEVEHAEDGPKDGEDKGGGELRGRHAAAAVLPGLSQ